MITSNLSALCCGAVIVLLTVLLIQAGWRALLHQLAERIYVTLSTATGEANATAHGGLGVHSSEMGRGRRVEISVDHLWSLSFSLSVKKRRYKLLKLFDGKLFSQHLKFRFRLYERWFSMDPNWMKRRRDGRKDRRTTPFHNSTSRGRAAYRALRYNQLKTELPGDVFIRMTFRASASLNSPL